MKIEITWDAPPTCLPVTKEELSALGLIYQKSEIRGDFITGRSGVKGYKALAMSTIFQPGPFVKVLSTTAYGVRTLFDVREAGYELEGRVCIHGKKHSAFTGSQMFELPDGELVNVAVIQVRMRGAAPKEE